MEASALHAPAGLARLSLPSALLKLRSDEQLVALFRAGNDEAFRVIHDRYRQRLFAYVRQMLAGSRSDAEDALQDVFLRAYNSLRTDERPVALKAWLYRVAHNRCVDQLRRPVPAPADVFDLSRPLMPDPLAETQRRDDLRKLVADVQALPDQQRSALLMRELEGLTYADLAAALDVTVPAVKSLLVRARIGLVEAAEARDTACSEIQGDLALSFGKGVRASAKARRHMRDCAGCREYRAQLRTVRTELGALLPGPGPLGLMAKLFGLGSFGAGAGGGGAAVVGGGAAAATTAKVAAIVCCAAVVGGGAAEIGSRTGIGPVKRDSSEPAVTKRDTSIAPERSIAPTPIHPSAAAPARGHEAAPSARQRAASRAAARKLRQSSAAPMTPHEEAITPHFRPHAAADDEDATPSTGGSAAPAEEPETTGQTGSPTATTDPTTGATVTAVVTGQNGSGSTSGSGNGTSSGGTTSSSPQATTASTSGTEPSSQGSTSTSGTSGGR